MFYFVLNSLKKKNDTWSCKSWNLLSLLNYVQMFWWIYSHLSFELFEINFYLIWSWSFDCSIKIFSLSCILYLVVENLLLNMIISLPNWIPIRRNLRLISFSSQRIVLLLKLIWLDLEFIWQINSIANRKMFEISISEK